MGYIARGTFLVWQLVIICQKGASGFLGSTTASVGRQVSTKIWSLTGRGGIRFSTTNNNDEEPSNLSKTKTFIISDSSKPKNSKNGPNNYLGSFNETLEFASYDELMKLRIGECVVSRPFTVLAETGDGASQGYDFCVKLYPRGGGHKAQHTVWGHLKEKNEKSGFGMSYALPSLFDSAASRDNQKVGVYLQFLPRNPTDTIDASFALRLKGQQRTGRRFDVEWRSGMRFTSQEKSNLQLGMANDFGSHLMQTQLFDFFLGILDESYESVVDDPKENERTNFFQRQQPVKMQVTVLLHAPWNITSAVHHNNKYENEWETTDGLISGGFGFLRIDDLRVAGLGRENNDREPLRVGHIIVPVLRKLSQRRDMFRKGVYPGVEYRLLRIVDGDSDQDLFYSQPGAEYELKPIYPLVQQLERPWPVRVKETDIPKIITRKQYNLISAVGSALAATSSVMAAFVISQAISIFVIPSRSMEPTLQKGDVLLVEKVSPRLFSFLFPSQVGDVVLFHPPKQLQELVAKSSGRGIGDRDLFVKRVAAVSGDTFALLDKSGNIRINGKIPDQDRSLCTAEPLRLIEQYMDPAKGDVLLQPGQVAVLGDCSSVSVDSRVWGTLPTEEIVGRPLIRLWPPSRFGPIESLPTTSKVTEDWNN